MGRTWSGSSWRSSGVSPIRPAMRAMDHRRKWAFGLVWLLAAVPLACARYASTRDQEVDVEALLHASIDDLSGVEAIEGAEVLVRDGVHLKSGSEAADGVEYWAKVEFSNAKEIEDRSQVRWRVRLDVREYRSEDAARRGIPFWCHESRFDKDQIEFREVGGGEYCISKDVQLRNDPEGAWLPSRSYWSIVAVRRGRLLFALSENRLGGPGSEKDRCIETLVSALEGRTRRGAQSER